MKRIDRILGSTGALIALVVGVIIVAEFLINLKTVFSFYQVFRNQTNFRKDFEEITQSMLSRILFYNSSESKNWLFFDFYKSACNLAITNNFIVFLLAAMETAFVKYLGNSFKRFNSLFKYSYRFFAGICLLSFMLMPISCHASGL
jgi:CDP-diglyceride synthetase